MLVGALWLLVLLLAVRFARFTVQAATRPSHGFVAAYTASRLLVEGADVSRFYDDAWFGAQVGRFEPGIYDIYVNPPTMALLMVPLAWFSYPTARLLWTAVTVLCLAGALGWLHGQYGWRDWQLPLCLSGILLYQPLYANLALGQLYIFLLLLLVMAWQGYRAPHDALLGIALGLMLVLKVAGVFLWLLLLAQRRWRAVGWGVVTAVISAIISLPWLGIAAWQRFFQTALASGSRPERVVTAYQTVASFFSHLFLYDAQWNPVPLWPSPLLGTWLPWLATAVLLLITLYALSLLTPHSSPSNLLFAAFAILSIILNPLSLDYHYPLLLLPIAILLVWWRGRGGFGWTAVCILLALFLIAADLPYRAPQYAVGAWAFLAYPKLYGALLLWGLCLWGVPETEDAA